MKKLLSVVLALICLFAWIPTIFASDGSGDRQAVSINDSYDTLLQQFTVVKSGCGMKYAYYSPVKNENDTAKYPLVIYIHGRFHGWNDKTFVKSGLTYWCCREIQSQFEAGGAHLLMPKLSEFLPSFLQTESAYKVIEEYIATHREHIDEDKILIMGGSAGGGAAWKLMIDHPDRFSAGVVLCSTKTPLDNELENTKNLPIWVISAKTDPLINYSLNQSVTWNRLCQHTNVGEQCRWSVFNNKVTLPDGSHPIISHFLAKTIGYNLCKISDLSPLPDRTINCFGEEVQLSFNNSIIQWFDEVK